MTTETEDDPITQSGGVDTDGAQITDEDLGGANEVDKTFAIANGWVPRAQWKGDPEKWEPAKSFADRGRGVNNLLRSTNERLTKQVEDMQRDLQEIRAMDRKSAEKEIANLKAQIQTRRIQAVEDGDGAAFAQAEKDLTELGEVERKLPATKSADIVVDSEAQVAANQWERDNPWFDKDQRKTRIARMVLAEEVAKDMSLKQDIPRALKRLDERLAAEYPEIFVPKTKDRPDHSRTEDGNPSANGSGSGGKKRTYKDMPKEFRDTADRMVRNKMLRSVEDYAKNYWEQQQ